MVDLDKGTVKVELKRSSLPDAAAMRLQVVGLDDGQFPQHQLKLEAAAAGRKPDRGQAGGGQPRHDADPREGKGRHSFHSIRRCATTASAFPLTSRGASVSVSVIHKAANVSTLRRRPTRRRRCPPGLDRRTNRRMFPSGTREMIARRRQIKAAQAQWSNVASNSKDAKAKKAVQDQLKALDEQENQINAIYQAVKKASDLQFRIYTEVGGEGRDAEGGPVPDRSGRARRPAAAGEAPSNLRRDLANLRP